MNFSQSEADFFEEAKNYVPNDNKRVIDSDKEVKEILAARKDNEELDLHEIIFKNINLAGESVKNVNLRRATFDNCNLNGTDFTGSMMDHVAFYDCDIRNMNTTDCKLRGASFRGNDMEGINLSGANIYAAVLEDAVNQDKVIIDDNTQWYKMRCPEEGPFIAWKCCTELRVVQMLVPADAKRCMATMETGRVSKVKVLSIKSIDETQSYSWAQSTVDQDFYYEVGKWLEPANGFQEDRWKDSSPGIHFFLERQQCVDYQSK